MDKPTFDRIRKIVYERSGIALGENKDALVSARIGKRMRALGIRDARTYLRYLVEDRTGQEGIELLNAVSTNVTSFFRESRHFGFLAEAVSVWLRQGQRRFRFWSAACSTGEEPYSIAITLLDTLERHGVNGSLVDMKVLATDLSTAVLRRCREGIYAEDKLQAVPEGFRARFFDLHPGKNGAAYAPKTVLRNMVVFAQLNLASPPFVMRGPFDAIFCRNVMIYFDNTVRRNLLQEIHRLLRTGGYLMVGHAEGLAGMLSGLKAVAPSVYVRR